MDRERLQECSSDYQRGNEDHERKNLGLGNIDVVEWCKKKILDDRARIVRQGKNWYTYIDGSIITVNASSYTIITAHKDKG